MVKYWMPILFVAFGTLNCPSSWADPDSSLFQESKSVKVLGRNMGGAFVSGTSSDTQQIQATATTTVLGKNLQPLQAFVNPPMNIGDTTYVEYYSFGARVFHESYYYSHDGILSMKAGIIPTEVRVPVFKYPVGPLVISIDGGARFQANVETKLSPTIMFPASMSTLEAKLAANASAAGFIEGSAKLLFMRAGVGGELSLVNAKADVDSLIFFDGRHPVTELGAFAAFLRGKIFSFFDLFSIFQFGWSRFSENDFYRNKGYCVSKGNLQCPAW
jgi:hypothetical protein